MAYLTQEMVHDYRRDGYLLFEDAFSADEVAALLEAVEHGERVQRHTVDQTDEEGRTSRLSIWFDLGDDIWSAASTHPQLVNSVRVLLGEEIAFYHGKVMLKEAHSGGAWEWHQDYGYWYAGFAFPHMMSAMVALDPATRENGCLQVLRGSHRLGRLEHVTIGSQTAVDPDRIEQVEPLFERVYCEMTPGSILFFHCNLLHASAPNTSDMDRRVFISCYSALNNPTVREERIDREPCPVSAPDAILRQARSR